jgi:hypothetical protein
LVVRKERRDAWLVATASLALLAVACGRSRRIGEPSTPPTLDVARCGASQAPLATCADALRFGPHRIDAVAAFQIQVRDVDGDGVLDVVTSRDVFFGLGDGSYETAVRFNESSTPGLVAVEDLDGSGGLDIAWIDTTTSDVTIVVTGDGRDFSVASTQAAAGSGLDSLAFTDVDGDGSLDIVRADRDAGELRVLLGLGDGTFDSADNVVALDDPGAMALADIDGDGHIDVLVNHVSAGELGVLLGDGLGGFSPDSTFSVSEGLFTAAKTPTLADVNTDGRVDVVTTDGTAGEHNVQVWLGDGTGGFALAATPYAPPYPARAVVADGDGDGVPDLLIVMATTALVEEPLFSRGNGDGTFQAPLRIRSGHTALSLAVGDLDGDGSPDVAMAEGTGISLVRGSPSGTFVIEHATAAFDSEVDPSLSRVAGMAFADFDRDGLLDVALSANGDFVNQPSTAPASRVLMGSGNGTFHGIERFGTGLSQSQPVVGDFDGDGLPDVVVAASGPGTDLGGTFLYSGSGDGTFGDGQLIATAADVLTSVDADADGRSDLLLVDRSSLTVLLTRGGHSFYELRSEVQSLDGSSPLSVAITDLNCDGHLDAVMGAYYSVGVSLGDPNHQFGPLLELPRTADPASDDLGSTFTSLSVADLNGDSVPDLLATAEGMQPVPAAGAPEVVGALLLFLGNGDGTFQTPQKLGDYRHPNDARIGDVNGDQRLDLAVSETYGTASILLGNGDGTFQEPQSPLTVNDPRHVAWADLDGNGRLELVAASERGLVTVLNSSGGDCANSGP